MPSQFHKHFAAEVCIGLDKPLKIRLASDADFTLAQCFALSPNAAHEIDASATNIVVAWSEIKRYARANALLVLLPDIPIAAWPEFKPFTDTSTPDQATARVLFERIFAAAGLGESGQMDDRIAQTIQRVRAIKQNTDLPTVAQLAQEAHLSVGRFRHLFQAQMGLSAQRYLLWQQLLSALDGATAGYTLTQAAHSAGFADAAHFSRVFRASFGLRAADIFKLSHVVQVIPDKNS